MFVGDSTIHPKCPWMIDALLKKNCTAGLHCTQKPPSFLQYPPVICCFAPSSSANWIAMSLLGASRFEYIEHIRNIALKHSKISADLPIRGPKRLMSAVMCVSRCNLILFIILDGSTIAKRSRMLSMHISTSLYKYWSI